MENSITQNSERNQFSSKVTVQSGFCEHGKAEMKANRLSVLVSYIMMLYKVVLETSESVNKIL